MASSPQFTIRRPESSTEIEAFFRLNAQVFRPDENSDLVASWRRHFISGDPDFHPDQLRGAFLGKTYMGGYFLFERTLCLGPARIRTVCVGGVVTHPDYRHQGIATALMQDAISHAHKRQHALFLLHGVPDFYYQFGFIDVLEDIPRHYIERKRIPEQTSETIGVRTVTSNDAPALLSFYQHHYGSYLGSFAPTRTVQRQEHFLRNWYEISETKPVLALSSEGELQGYLLLSRRWNRLYAYEVAAETWPATLALLQRHSQLLEGEAESPGELWWPLPPTDLTFYLLADHLHMRSEMYSYPNRGWMARPIHLPTLLEALLPLWQDRWQQSVSDWSGVLALSIDDYTRFLELRPREMRFVERPTISPRYVKLSQHVFTQLIFSFRPITWAAAQPGQSIPAELIPLLTILFPLSPAWIAGSDTF